MNMRCCFNPKLLVGAAIIATGIWFFAPTAALPVAVALVALACPVSMFLAMRRANQGAACSAKTDLATAERDAANRAEEIRALRAEIELLRDQREKR